MLGPFGGGDTLGPGEARIVRELDVKSSRETEAGRVGKSAGRAGTRRISSIGTEEPRSTWTHAVASGWGWIAEWYPLVGLVWPGASCAAVP